MFCATKPQRAYIVTYSSESINISDLVSQGWSIIADDDTGEPIAIRSIIRQWNTFTWAQRTYYQAKYGFDESGVLDIGLTEYPITANAPCFFLRNLPLGEFTIPNRQTPGSNHRLRTILEHTQLSVEYNRYDDLGLAYTGPDGTVMLTGEYCWGLPYPDDDDYTEIDNDRICAWETCSSNWSPTVPWWGTDPDAFNT